ncbi:MAG: nucleic acid-binding protein [Propionibacteriaceae bacterium]|jgi:predicted  nucleic acid-binding Zn-ribbon protein|nr:nucleic acid-binding protein [Propionibacteriaceae bacterium]
MKADPASQRRLLGLQQIDTAAARLERRVQTLPLHETIASLAARRSGAADDVTAAETRRSDAEAALAKAEDSVKAVRERLTRDQQRVESGQMDAKALASMVDEVDHLKGRVGVLEDAELAAMEALEQAEAAVVAAAARARDVEQGLRTAVGEREAAVAAAKTEMAGLRGRRQAAVGDLPGELVTLYDRLRGRYSGVGVGEFQGNRCTACGLEATAADRARYDGAPADEVLRCAECERILVRPAS